MSNTQHGLQNETPSGEVNTLEESDIADAVSGLHLTRKPSLPHDPERLHNAEDSESEEDVTEEHIDTIHTIDAPVPEPTRSTQSVESNQQSPIENQSTESREQENGNSAGTLSPSQQEEEEENSVAPLENIPRPANNFHQNGNNRGRSSSSASPSTVSGLLPRSQRVWEMDRQAPECRRCHRRFNFLVRRHHCR